jgi:hypothetical protein
MVWEDYINGDGYDLGYSLAFGAGGELYVGGLLNISQQMSDTFVRRYTPTGEPYWTDKYNDSVDLFDSVTAVLVTRRWSSRPAASSCSRTGPTVDPCLRAVTPATRTSARDLLTCTRETGDPSPVPSARALLIILALAACADDARTRRRAPARRAVPAARRARR